MPTGGVPLRQTATGTATAAGAVTITFQAPNRLRVWQGSVVLPSSPLTTSWSIMVGALGWGVMTGPGPYNVEARGNEQIVLTAKGLVAGKQYTCTLIGTDWPAQDAPPFYPTSPSGSVASNVPLSSASIGGLVGQPAVLAPSGPGMQTITYTPLVAGDILVIAIGCYNGGGLGISSVTDTSGLTWTVTGTAPLFMIYSSAITAPQAAITITIVTTGGNVSATLVELAQVAGPPVAPANTSATSGTAAAPTGTITAGEVIVSALLFTAAGTVPSGWPAPPWSNVIPDANASPDYIFVAVMLGIAPGTFGAVWTFGAVAWECASLVWPA